LTEEGSYGALFETGILIVRKPVAKHMTTTWNLATTSPQNDNNGRSSPRRPMTMMSGVLKSSHQALSIGRIVSLIGRLFHQSSRSKMGLESDRQLANPADSQIFKAEVKF